LNEAGDEGPFSLSIEVDTTRRVDTERFRSPEFGGAWRDPRCGGGFGGVVSVLNALSCAGFCLIGGDFIGSFCGVLKYGAPSVNCA
jgi:hypothetical protein